jgi:hypothetical protein
MQPKPNDLAEWGLTAYRAASPAAQARVREVCTGYLTHTDERLREAALAILADHERQVVTDEEDEAADA